MPKPIYVDHELLAKAVSVAGRKGYCSIPQAAALIGVTPQTLRRYKANGWIQTIMIGQQEKVMLDEIDRFKREGNLESGKDPRA